MATCIYCGQHIKLEDFMEGKAHERFLGDSAYYTEETVFYHDVCDINEADKYPQTRIARKPDES